MAWRDPLSPHERKVEYKMQLVVPVAHVIYIVVFTDEHSVAIVFVEDGTQFLHQLMQTRSCPLILEHVVPILFNQCMFLRSLCQFTSAAQLGKIHGDTMRCKIRVFKNSAKRIETITIHAEIK